MRRTRAEINALKPTLIAELHAGKTLRQVAHEYAVPLGTVATLAAGAKSVMIAQENKQVIGAKAYALITETLDTLHAQVEYFGSTTFLSDAQQTANAQGLAILYGVVSDKLLRFWEAYAGRDDDAV